MDIPVEDLPLALKASVRQQDGAWHIVCGQCDECGQVIFPRPAICPHCLCESLAERLVSRGGRLYTYTTVHAVRSGWPSPYHLCYVDFPEGVRICGPLDLPEGVTSPIDALVDVTVGALRMNGKEETLFSHRFIIVPTTNEGAAE